MTAVSQYQTRIEKQAGADEHKALLRPTPNQNRRTQPMTDIRFPSDFTERSSEEQERIVDDFIDDEDEGPEVEIGDEVPEVETDAPEDVDCTLEPEPVMTEAEAAKGETVQEQALRFAQEASQAFESLLTQEHTAEFTLAGKQQALYFQLLYCPGFDAIPREVRARYMQAGAEA